MTWIINVDVTEEDIKNGERGYASRCPVALAVVRAARNTIANGHPVRVEVCDSEIGVHTPGLGWLETKSNEVLAFVTRFDARQKVKPFEVKLTFEHWLFGKDRQNDF